MVDTSKYVDTIKYLVDKYNLNLANPNPIEINNISRLKFAPILSDLKLNTGAEVGVAEGWHAEILCKQNPNVHLYAIDVWKKYEGYHEYEDKIDEVFQEAQRTLADLNVTFVRKFSMDAVKDFADNSLDFVFIDGAHDFKNVAMDICEWSKKVRPGGIVWGHDYKRSNRPGKRDYHVKDVVQAYMYSHKISPWFVLNNNIKDSKLGQDVPCWLFVRQESDLL